MADNHIVTVGEKDKEEPLFNTDGHQLMTRKECEKTIRAMREKGETCEYHVYRLTEVD
jgi:hypothetical protein